MHGSNGYGTAQARSSRTSSPGRCCASGVPDVPGGSGRQAGGPVRTQAAGGVLTIVLDRPRANAVDVATSHALYEAFATLEADPDLRVGIITGSGDRFFCAGWDLKAAAAGEAPDVDNGVGGFGGIQELPNLNKPIIAAVNGM